MNWETLVGVSSPPPLAMHLPIIKDAGDFQMQVQINKDSKARTHSTPTLCNVIVEGRTEAWLIGHCGEEFNTLAFALLATASVDKLFCCQPEKLPLQLRVRHVLPEGEGICYLTSVGDGLFQPNSSPINAGELEF